MTTLIHHAYKYHINCVYRFTCCALYDPKDHAWTKIRDIQ